MYWLCCYSFKYPIATSATIFTTNLTTITSTSIVIQYSSNSSRSGGGGDSNNINNTIFSSHLQAMESSFGYSVYVAPSDVAGLGSGVVLGGQKGASQGQLMALYPGGLYLPQQPVLLPSLANPFILRCADGVLVDGSCRGLSGAVFRWVVTIPLTLLYYSLASMIRCMTINKFFRIPFVLHLTYFF